MKNLATSGFQLRPDITIRTGNESVAMIDAKWKSLDVSMSNSGVSSADAYQMNAYADRYHCTRLALVYPATAEFPPGHVTNFVLLTATRPVLEVLTIDVRDLAFGSGLPPGFDAVLPSALKRPQSPAPSFFAAV